jgi:glycosyltransferase involved in cell wall biosynthesis
LTSAVSARSQEALSGGRPTVSAIVPTHDPNRAGVLDRALRSVFRQTYPVLEVVVVADGAQARHVDSLPETCSGIPLRVVRAPVAGGPGAAKNLGAHEARGGFLAFLDDDDEWLPDKLEKQMALLESQPPPSLLFCDAEYRFEGRPKSFFSMIDFHGPASLENLCRRNFVATCSAAVVRRSDFEEEGGFDVSPAIKGLDDYDLWIRLLSKGRKAAFSPDLSVIHYLHGDNYSHTDDFIRNSHNFYRRNMPLLESMPLCHEGLRVQLALLKPNLGYHFRLGAYKKLCLGSREEAREWILKAIRYSPWHPKNYFYLVLTYFPAGIYNGLRRAKQAVAFWK